MIRKSSHLFLVAALLVAGRAYSEPPTAAEMLEKAIYQEEAVGDLDAALSLFHKIVSENEKIEALAAEAQVHIAMIHLKKGEDEKASQILKDLADRFPKQRPRIRGVKGNTSPAIDEAISKIREHYIDESVADDALTEAALRGVLGNLDRYSDYMDEDTLNNFRVGIDSALIGIGAVLELEDDQVMIRRPLPHSPAAESGLAAGEAIVEIDGFALEDAEQEERLMAAIKRIRGAPGKMVRLKVRKPSGDVRIVPVVRRRVKLESVIGFKKEGDDWLYHVADDPTIGYLRILSMTNRTVEEFNDAIGSMDESEMKGLIIDLRDNGGGMLPSALDLADKFLNDGMMLKVRGRKPESRVFEAKEGEILANVPLVFLVNRNTASAAEILAGSLQARERAVVIGERTFGKGTVQALFPLKSGGAIRLTTAQFFLPNGRNLEKPQDATEDDRWGVDPDQELAVTLTDEQREALSQHRNVLIPAPKSDGRPEDPALKMAIDQLQSR